MLYISFPMNFKFSVITVIAVFLMGNVRAQSKKEQILILSRELDSLNVLSKIEQIDSESKQNRLNCKIDSVNKIIRSFKLEFDNSKIELANVKSELKMSRDFNRNIKDEIFQARIENSELKLQLDSALKINCQIEMIFVEGGIFRMGSNDGFAEEKPIHLVTVSSFNIGKYEITQTQWKAVMGNYHRFYLGCADCPVDGVSWSEIQDFILKLNSISGKSYRLPTEAEWEFAAKGGNFSNGYKYSGSNNIESVAWFSKNSENRLKKVGSRLPNELGIHDMTGNVWEFCSDWYTDYSSINQTNPKGPVTGQYRVLRGGGWCISDYGCRLTNRVKFTQDRLYDYGFRLAINP